MKMKEIVINLRNIKSLEAWVFLITETFGAYIRIASTNAFVIFSFSDIYLLLKENIMAKLI